MRNETRLNKHIAIDNKCVYGCGNINLYICMCVYIYIYILLYSSRAASNVSIAEPARPAPQAGAGEAYN